VDLSSGTYTVDWNVLSTDEHMMKGKYTFTVALPQNSTAAAQEAGSNQAASASVSPPKPGKAPASPDQTSQMDMGTQQEAGGMWLHSVVRWVQYLAMMTLFGGFAFRLFVLVPALREVTGGGAGWTEAVAVSERRALALFWAAVILLVPTTMAALVLQASVVFDKSIAEAVSPALLWRIIKETGYGASWLLEALAIVVIVVILALLTRRRSPSVKHSALWWAGLAASAVLLVAPSWTGHAVAASKHFRLAVFSDWLHLLAGGFWVGGLFHLAVTWRPSLPLLTKSQRTRSLYQVIRLFTRIAIPSVALLVAAGLYNTWAHVPRLEAFWMTPYGKVLVLKLVLVVLMLLLGALHNFYYGKKAAALAKVEDGGLGANVTGLEKGFFRSVALEAGLGTLVLLVTAILVFMTPARNHPAMDKLNAGSGVVQQ
jgi:putative copper export protein